MLQQLKVSIKWTDIQQQWSDTTLTLTPPTRPFIYHHHSHSLASTFPLSLSEQHKEFFLPYFVPNLRSFYASLRLTPVCSLLSSPRFMGLAFSSLPIHSTIILSPELCQSSSILVIFQLLPFRREDTFDSCKDPIYSVCDFQWSRSRQ